MTHASKGDISRISETQRYRVYKETFVMDESNRFYLKASRIKMKTPKVKNKL